MWCAAFQLHITAKRDEIKVTMTHISSSSQMRRLWHNCGTECDDDKVFWTKSLVSQSQICKITRVQASVLEASCMEKHKLTSDTALLAVSITLVQNLNIEAKMGIVKPSLLRVKFQKYCFHFEKKNRIGKTAVLWLVQSVYTCGFVGYWPKFSCFKKDLKCDWTHPCRGLSRNCEQTI